MENYTGSAENVSEEATETIFRIRYHFISLNIIISLLVLILIVNLIGNTLAVFVIVLEHKMQSFSNWLIFNLAVADLCVALFCIPFEIPLELTEKWIYGNIFCSILYPLESATVYASCFTLVVLSYVRYRAITYPYLPQPNRRNAKQSICVIWASSLACVSPYILGLKYDSQSGQCMEVWNLAVRNVYTIATYLIQYIIPVAIMMSAYGFVIYEIVIKKNPSATLYEHKRRQKEDRRLIRLLVVVTVTFAVCNLPYHVVALCLEFGNAGSFRYIEDVSILSYVFLYSNSALNPILYNVFSSNFRSAMSDILRRSFFRLFLHNKKCLEHLRTSQVGKCICKGNGNEVDDELHLSVLIRRRKLSQNSFLSSIQDMETFYKSANQTPVKGNYLVPV